MNEKYFLTLRSTRHQKALGENFIYFIYHNVPYCTSVTATTRTRTTKTKTAAATRVVTATTAAKTKTTATAIAAKA